MEPLRYDVNGIEYHVLRWGSHSERACFVLLHGLGSNARIWELVAPLLAREGWGVIAPDLRGHGESEATQEMSSLAIYAADLSELIKRMELSACILAGHSWGGTLALETAAGCGSGADAPSGLVLLDGGIGQLNQIPGANWEAIREALAPSTEPGSTLESFHTRLSHPKRKWRPGSRERSMILASYTLDEQNCLTPRLSDGAYYALLEELWGYPTFTRFGAVRCPVLMLPISPPKPWSLRDHAHVFMNEQGVEEGRSRLKELQVRWLRNTVHDAPLQKPERVARELARFMRKLAS